MILKTFYILIFFLKFRYWIKNENKISRKHFAETFRENTKENTSFPTLYFELFSSSCRKLIEIMTFKDDIKYFKNNIKNIDQS